MSKKSIINILLCGLLITAFAFIWIYNQRLNYRKVFTLNTEFSLNANKLPANQLSSATFIIRYLNSNDADAKLSPETVTSSQFNALGRIINTKYGKMMIFEYESTKDAGKYSHPNVYVYKNLLLWNQENSQQIADLISRLVYETN